MMRFNRKYYKYFVIFSFFLYWIIYIKSNMTTVFNALETQQFIRGDGINHRLAVRAASTAVVDLATNLVGSLLDGITLAANDRILLKNQTDPVENGIYTVASGAGASYRAEDLIAGDAAAHINVSVKEGTSNVKTQWTCTTAGDVGTDALTWTMSSKFNYAQNDLLYASSSTELSNLSSTANRVLVTDGTGAISWNNFIPDGTGVNAAPSAGTDIVNKAYVDTVAQGLDAKESVRVRSTQVLNDFINNPAVYNPTGGSAGTGSFPNVKLDDPTNWDGTNGGWTIGDRFLVMNQTDAKQNGIYIYHSGSDNNARLDRAPDQDGTPTNEVSGGNFTFVEVGTTYAKTGWVLQGDGVLTLNTDNLNWVQFSAAGTFNAKDGISITGADISTDLFADGGIVYNGTTPNGKLQVDLGASAITGTVATAHGGTGLTTYTEGQLLVGNASNELTAYSPVALSVLTTDSTGAIVSWSNDVNLTNILGNSAAEPKLLEFSSNDSSVNYLQLANSLTTVAPRLSAAGSDADVSMQLRSKGTGAIEILGDTDAGTMRLYNADDTYYAGIKAGAMASNITWTWPLVDGSSDSIMRTDGSGVLSFVNPDSVMRQVIPLMNVKALANSPFLTQVAYFTWDQDEYGSVATAKLFYRAVVPGGKTLEVELYDETALLQLALGSHSADGFYSISVTLPTADALLSLRIRKTTAGGANPEVYGVSLVFNPAS